MLTANTWNDLISKTRVGTLERIRNRDDVRLVANDTSAEVPLPEVMWDNALLELLDEVFRRLLLLPFP